MDFGELGNQVIALRILTDFSRFVNSLVQREILQTQLALHKEKKR